MSVEKNRSEESPERVVDQCVVTQCMIDITVKQLNGLRTQCSTTEEITQKEICESEVQTLDYFHIICIHGSSFGVEIISGEQFLLRCHLSSFTDTEVGFVVVCFSFSC